MPRAKYSKQLSEATTNPPGGDSAYESGTDARRLALIGV